MTTQKPRLGRRPTGKRRWEQVKIVINGDEAAAIQRVRVARGYRSVAETLRHIPLYESRCPHCGKPVPGIIQEAERLQRDLLDVS